MAAPNRKRLEFGTVEAKLHKTIADHERNFDRWMVAQGYAQQSQTAGEKVEKPRATKKRRQPVAAD